MNHGEDGRMVPFAGRRADRWALAGLAVLARRDLVLAPLTHVIDTLDYTRYFAWLHGYVGDRLRAGHAPVGAIRSGTPAGRAVARRVDDAELEIETDSSAPGYVVLSEQHYPGWHAAVDGQPVPLQRADYVLTALPLPAGRHRVRYWYDPLSARLLVSGVSLVCVLGVVVRGRLVRAS